MLISSLPNKEIEPVTTFPDTMFTVSKCTNGLLNTGGQPDAACSNPQATLFLALVVEVSLLSASNVVLDVNT